MSRPPPIPFRDVSPQRGDSAPQVRVAPTINQSAAADISESENNNNAADTTAAMDGRPQLIPFNNASLELQRNDSFTRVDHVPIRHGSSIISESVLRQWGVSTTSSSDVYDFSLGGSSRGGWASASSGYDFGMDSLRIDRSASFDDDPRTCVPHPEPDLAPTAATHRRIASTGGNRLAIDVASAAMINQIFERGDSVNCDGDMILNGGLSALHDAARITDWPSVAALSQSNPESARYVGPDGWNAMHHACDRRCPHVEVIDSLLSAYPEAIVQTNDKGWTPLHRACRNKTPRDVVRLLLRKYPELGKRAASMRCNDGRSALHYALLYDAPEGVVDLLLQADPGAVLDDDRDGVSPLGTVWDKYANSFDGKRTLQILLRSFDGEGWELGGNNDQDDTERALIRQTERSTAERKARKAMEQSAPACKALQEKWQKANTLLRAYFHFPLQEDLSGKSDEDDKPTLENSTTKKRKWRILHATSAIKCHSSLFLLARALHPEQALEVDENDLLGGGCDVNSLPDTQSPKVSRRTALHFAAMSPLSGREGRNVIKVLLKLNLYAASRVDGYTSLPLHLICQNERKLHCANDGARDISNAYTEAASFRDGSGKTPLHCAASSAKHCTHCIPTTPGGVTPIVPTPADASVIEHLVSVNRTAASMTDNTGRLPLHYIAEHGEEWNLEAQSIFNAHPAAVRARAGPSTSNRLPLHMAASSPDARPSLIMNLVNANPRASSITDGTGRLPLHLAVDSGRTTWDHGIDSIYEAYIPAISAPEDSPRRWTVLHTAAASHSAGHELIEHIISLNENAASVADGEGRCALHWACAANRAWVDGGVQVIFDSDPSVALLEDVNGMLPFHISAMRNSVPSSPAAQNLFANSETNGDYETQKRVAREEIDIDDLESLQVLFNLLIAQPSIVQL
mmetsp:Transcript_10480/g.19271  ORF Transcript_10480/g.19271 Transcript_10480/m.19271 type:complete len:915 (+) Transcript_10480:376-3120(+)|eukprot:CAMPEP_0201669922 /NCGR_PEP_ID=MMETSP0494-20130426/25226_1 /ASSEMBLY_ACC=CAM_ASM_000839 /TAXON_ID=420259 /ORGANISM="Thalassiosira gravida, Strain GMp14c1" /LENGTH=914 /DNA_ID=CAMNT_0048150817 /DNA_START=299 /DNA_END=3043 /DNA_ORIENTATION=-